MAVLEGEIDGRTVESEAQALEVQGRSHIAKLLTAGEFPGSSISIDTAGSWKNMPDAIAPDPGHSDHWHINTRLR